MADRRRRSDSGLIAKDIFDEKRLVEAAICGDISKAIVLLDSSVAPDTPEYNRQLFYQSENYMTPLHYATAKGFACLTKLFIERGGKFTSQKQLLGVQTWPH